MIFLLITNHDSLPPLPDLARSEFPEPEFWIDPSPDRLRLEGFAGQYYGAEIDLSVDNMSLRGGYTREDRWSITKIGSASLGYSLFLPALVVRPKTKALYLERDRRYYMINPTLDFRFLTPSLIVGGKCDYTRWSISDTPVHETEGEIFLALDRLRFIPQLTLAALYTDENLKPNATAQLHIGNFHLKLGSPLKAGFPSPNIGLRYTEPWVNLSANVTTGVQYNTLGTIFVTELPIDYPVTVAAETLSWATDVRFVVKTHKQEFRLGSSYKEWIYRLNVTDLYALSGIREATEINLTVSARNRLTLKDVDIINYLHLSYNASDSTITFMPDYELSDTLVMKIGIFEVTGDVQHVSKRSGIGKKLQSYYSVGASTGLKWWLLKFYVAVANITNNKSEIYDDYFLTGRKYAAGIEFNKKL
ncbi:MAG: hypothetical protein JSW49_07500 [candidate division WOR-3 bacterium]|nr:MAG: hypothetical protein JSW49_07500 [candidate division WOR-3 bacterium]